MSPSTSVTPDAAARYDDVVEALERWEVPRASPQELAEGMVEYLNRRYGSRLSATAELAGPHRSCDVVVFEEIGIKIYREFTQLTVDHFKFLEEEVGTYYPYAIVFGFDLPRRDLDRWRMGRFRHAAAAADVEEMTFLRQTEADRTPEHTWPSRLWQFAEAAVALLAVLIGVELAVLLEFHASVYDVVGPNAMIAIVVVLAASLVVVYEQTAL